MTSSQVTSLLENSIIYLCDKESEKSKWRLSVVKIVSALRIPCKGLRDSRDHWDVCTWLLPPLPGSQGQVLGLLLWEGVLSGWALSLLSVVIYQALLKRKFVGANTPAWALHSWRCRHVLSALPPGCGTPVGLSFLEGSVRPEISGSPKRNLLWGLRHTHAWAV